MKKEKETKNRKKTIKPEKKKKYTQKNPPRRVNGLAQRRAHAGGAEFRSANGRSIEFPGSNHLARPRRRNLAAGGVRREEEVAAVAWSAASPLPLSGRRYAPQDSGGAGEGRRLCEPRQWGRRI
jgi:hypothetical protein